MPNWYGYDNLTDSNYWILGNPLGNRGTIDVGNVNVQVWTTIKSQSVTSATRFIYGSWGSTVETPYGCVLFTSGTNSRLNFSARGATGTVTAYYDLPTSMINVEINVVGKVVAGTVELWINNVLRSSVTLPATGYYGISTTAITIGRRPPGAGTDGNSVTSSIIVHGISTGAGNGITSAKISSAYTAGLAARDIVALGDSTDTQHLYSAKRDAGVNATWIDRVGNQAMTRVGTPSYVTPSAALVPMEPFCLGSHENEQGYYNKWKEAGVQVIRMDISWYHVESTRGSFNFSKYDTAFDAADENNLKVHVVLGYSTQWASSNPGDTNWRYWAPREQYESEWRDYIAAVVNRYRNRAYSWEIWNEADHINFLKIGSGTWAENAIPNAPANEKRRRQYLRLIDQAMDQAGLASLLISTSGWAEGGSGADTGFIEFLEDQTGWLNKFKVANYHTYGYPSYGRLTSQPNSWRAVGQRTGANWKEHWITEHGINTPNFVDNTTIKRYLIRTYAFVLQDPNVTKLFWFRGGYDPNHKDFRDVNGAYTAAFDAFKTLTTNWQKPLRFYAYVGPGSVRGTVALLNSGRRMAILWNDGSSITVAGLGLQISAVRNQDGATVATSSALGPNPMFADLIGLGGITDPGPPDDPQLPEEPEEPTDPGTGAIVHRGVGIIQCQLLMSVESQVVPTTGTTIHNGSGTIQSKLELICASQVVYVSPPGEVRFGSGTIATKIELRGSLKTEPRLISVTNVGKNRIRALFNSHMYPDTLLKNNRNYSVIPVNMGAAPVSVLDVIIPNETYPFYVDLDTTDMTDGARYSLQIEVSRSGPRDQYGLRVNPGFSRVNFLGVGTRPKTIYATAIGPNRVDIKFSKPMLNEEEIRNAARYQWDSGLVTIAVLDVVSDTVQLVTSDQIPGQQYTLTIS